VTRVETLHITDKPNLVVLGPLDMEVAWRGAHAEDSISLPKQCFENFDEVINQYYQLLSKLDEIVDNFLMTCPFDNDWKQRFLDNWTCGLIHESSWLKSTWFFDLVKFLALKTLLVQVRPKRVKIEISDLRIQNAIHAECQRINIDCMSVTDKEFSPSRAKYTHHLARRYVFMLWTVLLFCMSRLLGGPSRNEMNGDENLLISYFEGKNEVNWNRHSRYFGPLGDVLGIDFELRRIIKHVTGTPLSPGLRELRAYRKLRTEFQDSQEPIPLWQYTDGALLRGTLKRASNAEISFSLWKKLSNSILEAEPSVLILIEDSLLDSIVGAQSARTKQFMLLHEKLLDKCPKLQKLVFPFEGQDWERSLNRCLSNRKSFGPVKIYGFAHTFLKTWDLRGLTFFKFTDENFCLIVGNKSDQAIYDAWPYKVKNLVVAEPLRYMGLLPKNSSNRRNLDEVVIVESINSVQSRDVIKSFVGEVDRAGVNVNVRIRKYPGKLRREVPSFLFIKEGQLARSANQSTAAVGWAICCPGTSVTDYVIQGIPTIAVTGLNYLDMTPQLFQSSVIVVRDGVEAAEAMLNAHVQPNVATVLSNLEMNADLNCWRRILRDESNVNQKPRQMEIS
jgi:surface carbohydrate biosynthesis protein (TIGR04326 family)